MAIPAPPPTTATASAPPTIHLVLQSMSAPFLVSRSSRSEDESSVSRGMSRTRENSDPGEEVQDGLADLVGDHRVCEPEDVGPVLARLERDDLQWLRRNPFEPGPKRGRVVVEGSGHEQLGHAYVPNLVLDRLALVEVEAGEPDQSVGLQAATQRVQRLHGPEARAADDHAVRALVAQDLDRGRQILPSARVAPVALGATQVGPGTLPSPVVGQDAVPAIGEQPREREPLPLITGLHVRQDDANVARAEQTAHEPDAVGRLERHRL